MRNARWLVVAGLVALLAAALTMGLTLAEGIDLRERLSPQAAPLGTAFTYQGFLTDASGTAVDDTCDFDFGLYDAPTAGVQLGVTQTVTSTVDGGYFDVELNGGGQFGGGAFDGNTRHLAIDVRCGSEVASTYLGRVALNAVPYALFARRIPLAGSGTSPIAAHSDHNHDPDYQGRYKRTVVVSPVGNGLNARFNGLALLSALESVTGTAANRYLILIEPGVYDIYTATLDMKPYVDIQGSGEMMTLITSQALSDFYDGTINTADHAELRFLTVENTGLGDYAHTLHNGGHVDFHLSRVTLRPSGGSTWNLGILNEDGGSRAEMTVRDVTIHLDDSTYGGTGIYNLASDGPSDLTLIDVSIEGGGPGSANFTGIRNRGAGSNPYTATLTALNVTSVLTSDTGYTYGLQNTHAAVANLTGSTLSAMSLVHTSKGRAIYVSANGSPGIVTADHSRVLGSGLAVEIDGVVTHTVSLGASLMQGGTDILSGAGTVTCIGCYDASYQNSGGFDACP